MVASLDRPEMFLTDALVFALTRPRNLEDERWFIQTMSSFTDSQRGAVRAFLEYLRHELAEDWPDGEPGKALRSYWEDVGVSGTGEFSGT